MQDLASLHNRTRHHPRLWEEAFQCTHSRAAYSWFPDKPPFWRTTPQLHQPVRGLWPARRFCRNFRLRTLICESLLTTYRVLYVHLSPLISHAVDKLDNPNQTSYPEDRKSFPSSVPSPDNGYDAAAMQTLRPKTPSSTHNADSGPTSWTADGNSVLKQHCHGSAGPNGLLGSLSQTLDGFRRKSPSTTICSSSHCSDSSSPPSVTDLVTGTIPGPDDRSPIPTSKARSTTPTLLQPPDDDGTVSSPGVHVRHLPLSCPNVHSYSCALQIYIRRVVRNTAFFQFADKVDGAIEVPSELSKHPDLMLGDLFYHRSGTKCQMWIWEKETAQQLRWRPVGWGYERKSDRKVLILSEKKALPSWVQKSHFLKHTQGHPELQAMVMIPGSQT